MASALRIIISMTMLSQRPANGSLTYRIQPREDEVKNSCPAAPWVVKASGEQSIEQIVEPKERKACSFERIYFSAAAAMRKIYRERIALGYNLSRYGIKGKLTTTRKHPFSLSYRIPRKQPFYGPDQRAEIISTRSRSRHPQLGKKFR